MRIHKTFILFLIFSGFIAVTFCPDIAKAQNRSKPQLIEIKLNEKNSDTKAEETVARIVNSSKIENGPITTDDFHAQFIALTQNGRNNKFIISQFFTPEFGGCYAAGCLTVVYKNDGKGNEWKNVFAAFVEKIFIDENSKKNRHANLIFSEDSTNRRVGVWMWNGQEYELVNAK